MRFRCHGQTFINWRCQGEQRLVEQRLATKQIAVTPQKQWGIFKIVTAVLLSAFLVMLLGGPLVVLVSIVLLAKAALFIGGAILLFKLVQGNLTINMRPVRAVVSPCLK
jgi:hypothetical protein